MRPQALWRALPDNVSNARAIAWAICCSSSVTGSIPSENGVAGTVGNGAFTCLVDGLHRWAAEVGAVSAAQHVPRSAIDWSRTTLRPTGDHCSSLRDRTR